MNISLTPELDEAGCQLAAEGKHVVLFRVQEGVLQAVRVLHSAMDFKKHLAED